VAGIRSKNYVYLCVCVCVCVCGWYGCGWCVCTGRHVDCTIPDNIQRLTKFERPPTCIIPYAFARDEKKKRGDTIFTFNKRLEAKYGPVPEVSLRVE